VTLSSAIEADFPLDTHEQRKTYFQGKIARYILASVFPKNLLYKGSAASDADCNRIWIPSTAYATAEQRPTDLLAESFVL
jgi:hypothetical protein